MTIYGCYFATLHIVNVVIPFLRGGLASTAIAPMEIFQSAGVVWNQLNDRAPEPAFRVTTASVDGGPVKADGSVVLTPERAISHVRNADLIVVPAAGVDVDQLLARHGKLVPWLRRWYRRGAAIAGICTGVALLAEAGLLDGRRATTHWGLVDVYRRKYPKVDWRPEVFVTEQDDIYCGGGVFASVDLSLYLVERYAGHETAVRCAKSLLIDKPRTWQLGYATLAPRGNHSDSKITQGQKWLYENFRTRFNLDELARRLGMSPRNFIRRFKKAVGETPLAYLQKLRVAESKRLLEQDFRPIQDIAAETGYDDVLYFRKLFKRHVGVPPGAYRRQFGQPRPR
jgi:transcriptional regulator GlxA family with amidase domain